MVQKLIFLIYWVRMGLNPLEKVLIFYDYILKKAEFFAFTILKILPMGVVGKFVLTD